jgi:hypothetical protein
MEISPDQAEAFQQKTLYEGYLVIWTITFRTRDFGNRYVARPTVIDSSDEPRPRDEDGYLIADTLEALRAKLPQGLSWMDRKPADDPVIVEIWL